MGIVFWGKEIDLWPAEDSPYFLNRLLVECPLLMSTANITANVWGDIAPR